MTTKHTPGPWVVRDETNRHRGVLEVRTATHQKICGIPYMSGATNPRENARLIASAPTLYADNQALRARVESLSKALEACVETLADSEEWSHRHGTSIINARAALAKEGG